MSICFAGVLAIVAASVYLFMWEDYTVIGGTLPSMEEAADGKEVQFTDIGKGAKEDDSRSDSTDTAAVKATPAPADTAVTN